MRCAKLRACPGLESVSAPARRGLRTSSGWRSSRACAYFGVPAPGDRRSHSVVRGRTQFAIRSVGASKASGLAAYAAAPKAWLEDRNASIEGVGLPEDEHRSIGVAVLHLGGDDGRSIFRWDRRDNGPMMARRDGSTTDRLLAGRHANRRRAPTDPELAGRTPVGNYQRSLASGDLDASWPRRTGGDAESPRRRPWPPRSRGPQGGRRVVVLERWRRPAGACSVTDDGRTAPWR